MKSLNQFIKESIIKENFGEFKNAQEVATKIIDAIKDNEDKNKLEIDVSEFDLPFNTVVLTIDKIDYDDINAGYLYKETNFISQEIYINVVFNKIHEKDLNKIIIHELTHAICDFNLKKINKSLNELLLSNHFSNIDANTNAYKNSSNLITKRIANIQNKIFYYLNSSERNAYLSRLKSDIFDILDEHKIDVRSSNGYIKLLKYIKAIPMLKEIFGIGEFIENIKNLSEKEINSVIYKYNNMFIPSFGTKEKVKQNNVIKDIENMWAKFLKKFNEYIPKICAEYYEKHIL